MVIKWSLSDDEKRKLEALQPAIEEIFTQYVHGEISVIEAETRLVEVGLMDESARHFVMAQWVQSRVFCPVCREQVGAGFMTDAGMCAACQSAIDEQEGQGA